MAEHEIVQITDHTFDQEVLKSAIPVLVDFWAVWCGPCRAIAPVLEEIAGEFGGQLKVAKLNVDENTQTRKRYGVQAIPTLILFLDSQPVEWLVGAVTKKQLVSIIRNHVSWNPDDKDYYERFMGG
jgi:thioredoxin 1